MFFPLKEEENSFLKIFEEEPLVKLHNLYSLMKE